MGNITLDQARKAIAGTLVEGTARGLKPLGVVVLDAGGHPIAFERSDGASSGRFEIATAKAAGALMLGMSSRRIAEAAAERPSFVGSLASLYPRGLIPAAGGVIILGDDGAAIGAIGVTGDTSDNDEICALAGISAAGLAAQG